MKIKALLTMVMSLAIIFVGSLPGYAHSLNSSENISTISSENVINRFINFDAQTVGKDGPYSLFGEAIIAPGATGEALIRLHNVGRMGGSVRVLLEDPYVDDSLGDDDALLNLLIGDGRDSDNLTPAMDFIEKNGNIGEITRVHLNAGEVLEIPIRYEFRLTDEPYRPYGDLRQLSFTIVLHLWADTESEPPITPTVPPTPAPSPSPSIPTVPTPGITTPPAVVHPPTGGGNVPNPESTTHPMTNGRPAGTGGSILEMDNNHRILIGLGIILLVVVSKEIIEELRKDRKDSVKSV